MSEHIKAGDPAFGRLFTDFKYTAYRWEALDYYHGDKGVDSWLPLVTAARHDSKVMQRVHLVREPLSDYLRFELGQYERSAGAGEDIRILPRENMARMPQLPDYWLFDSIELWVMDYAPGGQFAGAGHVTDPARIVNYSYWRDAALHQALPLADYAARVPELRRAS